MPQRHQHTGPSPQQRSRPVRLGLEALEARTVLSGVSLVSSSFAADHILVRYQAGQAPVSLPGTSVSGAVEGLSGLFKVNLTSGTSVSQALAEYRGDARVQVAEPDYQLGSSGVPNDPRFADQWDLRNTGQAGGKVGSDIGATSAWNVSTGSSKIIVSVMDTGIDYTHPDLYPNIWVNQGEIPASRRANLIDVNGDGLINLRDLNDARNQGVGKITDLNGNGFIDAGDLLEPMVKTAAGADTGQGGWANDRSDDGDQFVDDICGWNFVDNSNDPMDDFGHGTHVAGTIGAVGNNGVGIAGIDWSVQLMPIKFMNSTGAGSVSAFIAGLNYAVEHGAKISNNSWTGSGDSTLLGQAVQNAQLHQHIFVAAAGNFGSNNDASPTFPASFTYDNVLSVAATDRNDNLASFSNYGAKSVDLAAPGVDTLSTTLGGGYGYNSGTSMATPHVTGAAALIWAHNPTWTYQMVINRILGSAERLPSLAGKTVTGGRLNIAAALGAPEVTATAPTITSSSTSGPAANTVDTVTVTFDRAIALSTFTSADVLLTGPSGNVIGVSGVQVVSGSGDRTFKIRFATQSTAGNYSIRVGPEVTDVSSIKMATWSRGFSIAAVPVATSTQPTIVGASGSGTTAYNLTKVRVTFSQAMNASTFGPADVKLTGPSGNVIGVSGVALVANTGGKAFDITFAAQTTPGSYTMVVGPEVTNGTSVKMKLWSGVFKVAAPVVVTQPTIVGASGSGTTAYNLTRVRVTFSQAMNAATFTPTDVKLTGPSGNVIGVSAVTLVANTGGKTFDITFAAQTTPGSYTMVVGPEVVNGASVKMKLWSGVFKVTSTQPVIVGASGSGTTAYNLTKVRVTFDQAMNASTFTPADVKLTGPSGNVIGVSGVALVANTGGKAFDITFAVQTAPGSYTMVIGPEVTNGTSVKMKLWSGILKVASAQPIIVGASGSGTTAHNLTRVRVTFDRAMNASTFTRADVKLTGPSGNLISVSGVTLVANTGGRTFDITFATQTKVGSYGMVIGPEVFDSTYTYKMKLWSGVFKVNAPTAAAASVAATTYTSPTQLSVAPNGKAVSLLSLGGNGVLVDLNVQVNVTHPRVSDLYIHLQAPDGTDVVLFDQGAGAIANMDGTVFDDQASASIGPGTGSLTGSFRPITPLANLFGKNLSGTWKLWVEDRAGVNRGTIDGWSLIVKTK